MDMKLEERLLGRDGVVLNVWYHFCAYVVYVVHVASMMLCACGVVYIQCVYMLFMQCYIQGGTYSVVCALHMQCRISMVLCTYWICGVVYILYCVHDGYAVLCAYGVVHMLDMQ